MENNTNNKEVTKTWVSGQNSCTLVIPRSVAKEYGLDSPSHVVVERIPQGILIRKLRMFNVYNLECPLDVHQLKSEFGVSLPTRKLGAVHTINSIKIANHLKETKPERLCANCEYM
jgi:antitoxin component of MazEF toxin-antitoxin module